jgi:putative component of toxin-antitoxin plasmid stabilization module
VKTPLEVHAYEIYAGSVRSVAALALDGSDDLSNYLASLRKSNPKGHAILHGYFKTLCNERELHERGTYKCLDRATGLYEFRLSSLRLYCFVYENTLVLLTNGGTKNNNKEQSRDIAKARKIQQETLDRIKAGANIDIITP